MKKWIDQFLISFEKFALNRVSKTDTHFKDIIGKTFCLRIKDNKNYCYEKTLKFGKGLVSNIKTPNKECITDLQTFDYILKGDALFEDLYTG